MVVLGSLSKTYAMTGWRLGYALSPAAVTSAMAKLQSQSTSNPTSIVQKAAVAALKGPQECVEEVSASAWPILALDAAIEREVGQLRTSNTECAACGASLSPGARFCPACGAIIKATTP